MDAVLGNTLLQVDSARYYGGPSEIGPNIDGKNSEIYRFLCVPQVLFNMVPRIRDAVGNTLA